MFKTIFFQFFILFCFSSLSSFSGFAQSSPNPAGCKPEIDVSGLLNKISVRESLSIGSLYARCLPAPARKSQTVYAYHPYDGGKLSATLKNSGGQIVNSFVWYAAPVAGLWELSRYEVVGGREALKKLGNGNYTLEFAIEDKVFQTLPFSVTAIDNKDPYNPQTVYLLDGMWKDYATLYSPNTDRFIQLIVWLRDAKNVGEFKPAPVSYRTRLIRDKDKQLLAENSENPAFRLTPNWQSYTLSFRKPNAAQTKDYSEFKLNEILANDGSYTIELLLDEKPYSTYKLNVKNGMINDIDVLQMRKERYRIIIPLTARLAGR